MATSSANSGPHLTHQARDAFTFVFTTLIHEPASIATLAGILLLSVALDYGWKRSRPSSPVPVQVGP